MTDEERATILDRLDPRIDAWAAMWWGTHSVQAAAIGHPWRRVAYGPGLLCRMNAALRPYRYTMRRKVRKVYP